MKVNILDKGSIELLDHMGNDLMVANTARVSFHKWHKEFDEVKDVDLVRFLGKHNHWSPFAHPKIHLRIKMPIFVHRQWDKTRVGFDRNEVSRRYVTYEPEFYLPDSWRGKPTNGAKQGSSGEVELQALVSAAYRSSVESAEKAYEYLLDCGVAPEQARIVLPLSSYTEMIETGSLYGYARMYWLRASDDAQWEIRQYANALDDIMSSLFPVSWPILTAHELPPEEEIREESLEQRVKTIEDILKDIREEKYTAGRVMDGIDLAFRVDDCCNGHPNVTCDVCGCVYMQDEMRPCTRHSHVMFKTLPRGY